MPSKDDATKVSVSVDSCSSAFLSGFGAFPTAVTLVCGDPVPKLSCSLLN